MLKIADTSSLQSGAILSGETPQAIIDRIGAGYGSKVATDGSEIETDNTKKLTRRKLSLSEIGYRIARYETRVEKDDLLESLAIERRKEVALALYNLSEATIITETSSADADMSTDNDEARTPPYKPAYIFKRPGFNTRGEEA